MRLSHVPLRLATGAFVLNAGLSKRSLSEEAAAGMQSMAKAAVPQVESMSPTTFALALSSGEVALGVALLTPFVSPVAAGAALTAFSGTLLRMWWRTPGMHEEGSPRPTQQGTAIAKDVWMLGSGLALVIDGLADKARRGTRKAGRRARRKAKKAKEALSGD